MKILTVLPVSRPYFFDIIIEPLLNQTVKIENLLVIVDSSNEDYITIRNKVQSLNIDNKICIQATAQRPASTIAERRWHIVNIHNQVTSVMGDYDWVFSVEDDGVLPLDALEKLIDTVGKHPNAGMVTGVELGRWGTKYVGAWRVDDCAKPSKITSLNNKVGENLIEPIDGCGLYCALIRGDSYKLHQFDTRNGLGPDVNLGLYLRNLGYMNYIDWRIPVTHLTEKDGKLLEIPATDEARVVSLHLLSGQVWKQ